MLAMATQVHLAVYTDETGVTCRDRLTFFDHEPALGHFCSTLKQSRVNVEHLTRVSFTARWATQQKRHLTIRDRLLGQVVVNAQSGPAGVAGLLGNGHAGVRGQELKWSGVGRSCSDDRRV